MSEPTKKSFTEKFVEWALICLLAVTFAAVGIPSFIKSRTTSAVNACVNNLRQIDGAKQAWALKTGNPSFAVPTENDITPYLKLDSAGHFPRCPEGGVYTIRAVSENPTCSVGNTVTPGHVLP